MLMNQIQILLARCGTWVSSYDLATSPHDQCNLWSLSPKTLTPQEEFTWPNSYSSRDSDNLTADLALLALLHALVGVPALWLVFIQKLWSHERHDDMQQKHRNKVNASNSRMLIPAGLLSLGHPGVRPLVPNSVGCLLNLPCVNKIHFWGIDVWQLWQAKC